EMSESKSRFSAHKSCGGAEYLGPACVPQAIGPRNDMYGPSGCGNRAKQVDCGGGQTLHRRGHDVSCPTGTRNLIRPNESMPGNAAGRNVVLPGRGWGATDNP